MFGKELQGFCYLMMIGRNRNTRAGVIRRVGVAVAVAVRVRVGVATAGEVAVAVRVAVADGVAV